MELVIVFVGLIIGGLFGGVVVKTISRKKSVGAIRIDRSDPDGPYLFLELETNLSTLTRKKYVVLEIRDISYISHE